MKLDYTWSVPYRGGWAHAAGSQIRDVPFHYKNPVTGRVPAILLT
jgi:hypothetical protein